MKDKKCTQCRINFPETDEYFYLYKCKRKNGIVVEKLSSWCKLCVRLRNKNHGNKNKDKRSVYFKNWYQENKEKENQRVKEWREDNKDHIAEYFKEYQQTEEFKQKMYSKFRGQKNHRITEVEWINCKTFFDFRCAYCNMPEELHKELFDQQLHREHVLWDGANDLSNCVPSCRCCNSQKWKHPMEDWYIKQKYYSFNSYQKIQMWIESDHKKFLEKNNSK